MHINFSAKSLHFGSNQDLMTQFMTHKNSAAVTPPPVAPPQESGYSKKDILTVGGITAAVGLSAVATIVSLRNGRALKNIGKELSDELAKKIKEVQVTNTNTGSKIDKTNIAVAALAGVLGGKAADVAINEAKEHDITLDSIVKHAETARDKIKEVKDTANNAAATAESAHKLNTPFRTRTVELNGKHFRLLSTRDKISEGNKTANARLDEIIKNMGVREASSKRVDEVSKLPVLTNPRIFIPTSETMEFMKAGGIADVPVEIAQEINKINKEYGQHAEPELWTPLYLGTQKVSGTDVTYSLVKLPGETEKYEYTYGNTASPNKIILEKVFEKKIPVNDGTKQEYDKVVVYSGIGPKSGVRHNFIHSELGKFDITAKKDLKENAYGSREWGPYVSQDDMDEPERFGGIFSKYAYEIGIDLKAKAIKGEQYLPKGENNYTLKPPDAIMGNDWQAAPMAALTRYLTPFREQANELPKELLENHDIVQKQITDIPFFMLIHNAQHQGVDGDTQKTFNQMFGKYAADIAEKSAYAAPDLGWNELTNTLMVGDQMNMLHMGTSLADRLASVSINYGKELSDQSVNGVGFGERLKNVFTRRYSKGSLKGITNGNEKAKNMLTENAIKGLNKEFNGYCDKMIPIREDNFVEAKKQAKLSLIKVLQTYTDQLKDTSVQPGNRIIKGAMLKSKPDTSVLTENTPIFSFVGRGEDQKGLDILMQSLAKLYKDFDTKYKGKEKPFVIIQAGGSAVDNKAVKMLADLGEDQKRVMILDTRNTSSGRLLKAGVDLFMIPSWFEPCGLTQGEALPVGTLVAASNTGGLPDTVVDYKKDKDNATGFLTEKLEPLQYWDLNRADHMQEYSRVLDANAVKYKATLGTALDVYYNDRPHYTKMGINAVKTDLSWNLGPGKGPIWEYIELMNIKSPVIERKKKTEAAKK